MAKVLSTDVLRRINKIAKDLKRRHVPQGIWDRIDPNGVHVAKQAMANDDYVRCMMYVKILGKSKPEEGWLDMNYDDFNALPTTDEVYAKMLELRREDEQRSNHPTS